MRKLASVRVINEIIPIENADAIEIAVVDGWNCVVKKGAFRPREMVVYFEIDSFLPIHECFEFLRKTSYKKMGDREGFRLKTIRLRGVYSQGLLVSISDLISFDLIDDKNYLVGEDLTDRIGVIKYEPPVPAQLSGVAKGLFPSYIFKTDEERVQNFTNYKQLTKDTYYVTEKLDGSSATFFLKDGQFGVCSRNLELKETDDNSFWKVARKMEIEQKLLAKGYDNIAIQGELIGEGVQGNKYKISGQRVRFFNLFNITTQKYYHFDDFKKIINDLGFETVPIVDENFSLPEKMEDLILMADGKSLLNEKADREGLVFRTKGENRVSFKAISNKFLLGEKD